MLFLQKVNTFIRNFRREFLLAAIFFEKIGEKKND